MLNLRTMCAWICDPRPSTNRPPLRVFTSLATTAMLVDGRAEGVLDLRQYGHKASSYIDNTTVGWPVPGSVITLLDATRIALASAARAVGPGDPISAAVTTIINAVAVAATRVSRRMRLVLATRKGVSPRTEPKGMAWSASSPAALSAGWPWSRILVSARVESTQQIQISSTLLRSRR